MSHPDTSWLRLVARARRADPGQADSAIPAGFATRVVARSWASAPASRWSLLERFAVRGFWAAAACCVAAIAFGYAARTAETMEDAGLDDPVAVLLDLS